MSEESSKFIEAIVELWKPGVIFLVWIFREQIKEMLPKLNRIKVQARRWI